MCFFLDFTPGLFESYIKDIQSFLMLIFHSLGVGTSYRIFDIPVFDWIQLCKPT